MASKQVSFGIGNVFLIRTDVAVATPVQIGIIQSCDLTFAGNLKELTGQNQLPEDIARGAVKITGKCAMGRINLNTFDSIFFGQGVTTGETQTSSNEGAPNGTAIPATPFQITVSNSAHFIDDCGVVNATNGIQLTKVASAPATGQYSVAAGVYTFAAADTGNLVLISYTYTQTTSGGTITAVTQLMGFAPTFKLVLNNNYGQTGAKNLNLILYQCRATSFAMNFKNEDYMMPTFDFSCFTDSIGRYASLSADQL